MEFWITVCGNSLLLVGWVSEKTSGTSREGSEETKFGEVPGSQRSVDLTSSCPPSLNICPHEYICSVAFILVRKELSGWAVTSQFWSLGQNRSPVNPEKKDSWISLSILRAYEERGHFTFCSQQNYQYLG